MQLGGRDREALIKIVFPSVNHANQLVTSRLALQEQHFVLKAGNGFDHPALMSQEPTRLRLWLLS